MKFKNLWPLETSSYAKSDWWRHQMTSTRLLMLGLICFFAWASLSQMDQTVRSNGQLIAISRNQIIQAADGGVLTQLLVSEGQQVKAGQAVATLETTRSEASFSETQSKLNALQAALARAKAESSGDPLQLNQSAAKSVFNAGQHCGWRVACRR
jgi:multidrug efflux pump subunit AcrA (membrane-fusion protein)